MTVRFAATLPEEMTTESDGEEWERGDRQVGYCLNRRMVHYLNTVMRGLTIEERLLQLEDRDILAFRAVVGWRAGHSVAEMAVSLRASERSVRRWLARGRAALEQYADPQTESERLDWLEVNDPVGLSVYLFAVHGWTQEHAAAQMGIPVRAVRRAYERAGAVLGTSVEWRSLRHYQDRSLPRAS